MDWLSFAILALIALSMITTFALYKSNSSAQSAFFSAIELHYTMAVLGILAILLLAHLEVIDKSTVATLFSSLIAYVLGASAGKPKSNDSAILPSEGGSSDTNVSSVGSSKSSGGTDGGQTPYPNIPV